MIFLFALSIMILARTCRRVSLWSLIHRIMKSHATGGAGGIELGVLEDTMDEAEAKKEDGAVRKAGSEAKEKEEKKKRSLLTKLKIVVAAWQISSSTDTVRSSRGSYFLFRTG